MARKKVGPKPAVIVTSYTDSVTLLEGDTPFTVNDLRALLEAVDGQWFDNDKTRVEFLNPYFNDDPRRVIVIQETRYESKVGDDG